MYTPSRTKLLYGTTLGLTVAAIAVMALLWLLKDRLSADGGAYADMSPAATAVASVRK